MHTRCLGNWKNYQYDFKLKEGGKRIRGVQRKKKNLYECGVKLSKFVDELPKTVDNYWKSRLSKPWRAGGL